MTKYYQKELPDSPVYVLGHPLKFDVLETADNTLIAELDSCVRKQIGGVREITAEQYAEEVKKKELEKLSNGSSKPRKRTELSALLLSPGAAVGGGSFGRRQNFERETMESPRVVAAPQVPPANMPDPIQVPTFTVPPTAKMKDHVALKDKAAAAAPNRNGQP